MKTKKQKNDEELDDLFDETYDKTRFNIPTDDEIRNMSTTELAKHISACNKNGPVYILLSHELSVRLINLSAKKQFKGAIIQAIVAVLCVFLGWFLSLWLPFPKTSAVYNIPNEVKKHPEISQAYEEKQVKLNASSRSKVISAHTLPGSEVQEQIKVTQPRHKKQSN